MSWKSPEKRWRSYLEPSSVSFVSGTLLFTNSGWPGTVLTGVVNNRDEPVVRLHLLSSNNRFHPHPVIIDTGFNGNLSVPEKLAKRYGWSWIGNESYEIATGDVVEQKVFLGEIRWFGHRQQVYTVASHADDILMGTRLLRQKRLTINFQTRKLQIV